MHLKIVNRCQNQIVDVRKGEEPFLSHLLIARCEIGVQLSVRSSVRSFVRSSVRPSTIYVKVLTL